MAFRLYQKPIDVVGGQQTGNQQKINSANQDQQRSLSNGTTRSFHPFQLIGTVGNNTSSGSNNTVNNMKRKADENDTLVDCTLRLGFPTWGNAKPKPMNINLNLKATEVIDVDEAHPPVVNSPRLPPPPPQMRLAPGQQAPNPARYGGLDPRNRMQIRPCRFRSSMGTHSNFSNNNGINKRDAITENMIIGGGGPGFSSSVAVPACPPILPIAGPGFLRQWMINLSSASSFARRIEPGQPRTRKQCSKCHATETPLWRNGPFGLKTLCNACGIRYRKFEKKFHEGDY